MRRLHALPLALPLALLLPLMLAGCAGERARDEVMFGLGRAPEPAELARIDIDVTPNGDGLPEGNGVPARGEIVYREQCASCHGANGEGIRPSPALVGRTPAAGHVFALDPGAPQTIGNYWPYATTVFDYVRRAMPLKNPGSLSNAQTYDVVAYLLAANGLIAPTDSVTRTSLPRVVMPARRFFVPEYRSVAR